MREFFCAVMRYRIFCNFRETIHPPCDSFWADGTLHNLSMQHTTNNVLGLHSYNDSCNAAGSRAGPNCQQRERLIVNGQNSARDDLIRTTLLHGTLGNVFQGAESRTRTTRTGLQKPKPELLLACRKRSSKSICRNRKAGTA